MKKFISDFALRGLIAAGIGPAVLAIVYLVLRYSAGVKALSTNEVCIGIFSLTALAFIAGGMNAIYQIERLPLMTAILIHGSVLYISYLITYLLNGWLRQGIIPIAVFSAIFAVGYFVIWIIIYSVIRRNTAKINKIMEEKRKYTESK
jgi:hypothetical protein